MTPTETLAKVREIIDQIRKSGFVSYDGEKPHVLACQALTLLTALEQTGEWLPIPKGWHVSWMGEDEGHFLCQIKRHDDDLDYISDISFVSRTSLRSAKEAYDECIFTIMQEYQPPMEGDK